MSEDCEVCDSMEVQEVKSSVMDKIKWRIRDFKYSINSFLVNISLKIIRNATKDSNSLFHAKQEFLALGYTPIEDYKEFGLETDDPNKWIQENILDLLAVFSSQGHSGFSASYCSNYFNKLSRFEPLSPIKCTDDEWAEPQFDDETYQNKRLSSVFKKGKGGKPYYLDAIVFRDQNDCTFTGCVENISSAQNIKLPFVPKTFYVDVISIEWADKKERIKKEGGGWWTSKIKDPGQLVEVFEYYERGKDDKSI